MALFKGSLAGPGYVILNILRVMNIISLLAIIAASGVMLAKTLIETNFFFFDSFMHVAVAAISGLLICTELNFLANYFNRNWPLYGQDSGFVTFGATMGLLGISTLGSLNTKATSQESLGLAFWRTVLGAGIVAIIFGILSIVVSFIFRDRSIGVTARHVRAHGAVAAQEVDNRISSSMTSRRNSDGTKPLTLSGKSSLPIYHEYASHIGRTPSSTASSSLQNTTRFPVNISSPVNLEAAQFAAVERSSPNPSPPNPAHHPALRGGEV